MSSDSQLRAWAAKNIAPPNFFCGVFMSDETDDARRAVARSNAPIVSGIFNYDPRGKGGSHWVAFRVVRYAQKAGEPAAAYWFDSYGTAPDFDDSILHDHTHFRQFLNEVSSSGKVIVSGHDIQALETTVCGNYALLFCKEGLPDRKNPAWRQVLDAASRLPESFAKSKVTPADQFAARERDEAVKKIVRL